MRRAPSGGYDFSRKRDYRRKVWATGRESLKESGLSVAESHALLMPSLEGDEIEVALNAGFREQHLHIVDMNPAIVATLKRRYPRVNTYGVTVSRAMERIVKDGVRLRFSNVDLCGMASMKFFKEIGEIAVRGSVSYDGRPSGFDECAVVAVSQLRGREATATTEILKRQGMSDAQVSQYADDIESEILGMASSYATSENLKYLESVGKSMGRVAISLLAMSERDRQRVFTVGRLLSLDGLESNKRPFSKLIRTEHYLSSNGQTMLWSVWGVETCAYRASAMNDALREALKGKPVKPDKIPARLGYGPSDGGFLEHGVFRAD